MDVNPTYPLFSIFSFLGFLLVLIPLPWHWQAWNAGTCSYIAWTALACLSLFINSVVWRNSVLNVAPVWCDITTKLLIGASVGIPAAGLCISRRLYKIAVIKSISVAREDKRRAVLVDLCISVGLPVLVMAMHIVVQGHRFDILEDVGCWPAIYNTLPSYFIIFMWPSLLGCMSFVYSGLMIYAFYQRRLEFSQLITSDNSLSASRYIRLMLLALIEMSATIPISIVSTYLANQSAPIQPWISWANTHYDFWNVGMFPAIVWRSVPSVNTSIEMTRWIFPGCAALFFVLFGFGSEARRHYHSLLLSVIKPFRCKVSWKQAAGSSLGWKSTKDSEASAESLPVYASHIKGGDSFALSPTSKVAQPDLETAPHYSSYAPPQYSLEERAPSFSPSDFLEISSMTTSDVESAYSYPIEVEPADAPALHHRPFTAPSIFPIESGNAPYTSVHGSGISIVIQTQSTTTPY